MARQGNRPDRRIARSDLLDGGERERLANRVAYVGSAHHKRSPGDYGFHPPANPRPSKSLCDGNRVVPKEEALRLLKSGISAGMFSTFTGDDLPKYVWCVNSDGEAYEAKLGTGGYHGYRLEEDDDMRSIVIKEWKERCPAD